MTLILRFDFLFTAWPLCVSVCVCRPPVTVIEMNPADNDILTEVEDLVGVGAGDGDEEVQRKSSNIQKHRF